jgi:hypothetical protein
MDREVNDIPTQNEIVRVPSSIAEEAWQWIIDRGGVNSSESQYLERTTSNLARACKDGRKHIEFILDSVEITDSEKMIFKLTFAG